MRRAEIGLNGLLLPVRFHRLDFLQSLRIRFNQRIVGAVIIPICARLYRILEMNLPTLGS